jgi:hypothetical protein
MSRLDGCHRYAKFIHLGLELELGLGWGGGGWGYETQKDQVGIEKRGDSGLSNEFDETKNLRCEVFVEHKGICVIDLFAIWLLREKLELNKSRVKSRNVTSPLWTRKPELSCRQIVCQSGVG